MSNKSVIKFLSLCIILFTIVVLLFLTEVVNPSNKFISTQEFETQRNKDSLYIKELQDLLADSTNYKNSTEYNDISLYLIMELYAKKFYMNIDFSNEKQILSNRYGYTISQIDSMRYEYLEF